MLVTIRLEMAAVARLGTRKAAEDFASRMESACCYLMLRMWAEGLFTADGWTIQRIEQRSPENDYDRIVNLRPFNNKTRQYFRESERGTQR